MGKLVKFCNSCEEGFAEKFSFCPNCGGKLIAYEMNPVSESPEIQETISASNQTLANTELPPLIENPVTESSAVETYEIEELVSFNDTEPIESASFSENRIEQPINFSETEIEANQPVVEDTVKKEAIWDDLEEDKSSKVTINSGFKTETAYEAMPSSMYRQSFEKDDSYFNVTIIEDKKSSKRRMLLLGFGALVLAIFSGWWLYSLFTKDLDVAALGSDDYLMSLIPELQPSIVEEIELEKNKDKGGGGGGGGRDEQDPVSKGRLANQTENPLINPSKTIIRRDNSELTQPIASTQGKEKREQQTDVPYGDPNSSNISKMSDGSGIGGGQGGGFGSGQGNGRGTGRGNGEGSGIGDGRGNGRGNGTGDQSGEGPPPTPLPKPPPTKPPTPLPTTKPAGVTQDMRILSKPKPGYTDAARQQNVTGVVRLRVTFSANGSIGGITPVSGLPYGLTEQAIAAARGIRFEPKKIDGVAQSVTRVVEFSFTIY